MTDPIADLLTRIRNAYLAQKNIVTAPYSKTKEAICQILVQANYLDKIKILDTRPSKTLELSLKYVNKLPAITYLERVSKPGRRVYVRTHKLPRPLSNQGLAIISTSQGIMTNKLARKKGIGGEIICQIW
jgi:small subunit ribosomal protein S8